MEILNRLRDHDIKNAKPGEKDYRLSDGGGLYLVVNTSGGKLWRWSLTKQPKLGRNEQKLAALKPSVFKHFGVLQNLGFQAKLGRVFEIYTTSQFTLKAPADRPPISGLSGTNVVKSDSRSS
jgi:hypothetical protein